jgi:hypothetical protein
MSIAMPSASRGTLGFYHMREARASIEKNFRQPAEMQIDEEEKRIWY